MEGGRNLLFSLSWRFLQSDENLVAHVNGSGGFHLESWFIVYGWWYVSHVPLAVARTRGLGVG